MGVLIDDGVSFVFLAVMVYVCMYVSILQLLVPVRIAVSLAWAPTVARTMVGPFRRFQAGWKRKGPQ